MQVKIAGRNMIHRVFVCSLRNKTFGLDVIIDDFRYIVIIENCSENDQWSAVI